MSHEKRAWSISVPRRLWQGFWTSLSNLTWRFGARERIRAWAWMEVRSLAQQEVGHLIREYRANPDVKEHKDGEVTCDVGSTYPLFSTDQPGFVGGVIFLQNMQNGDRVEIDWYALDRQGIARRYNRVSVAELQESPTLMVDEYFCPYGAYATISQTTGRSRRIEYSFYRR